MKTLLTFLTLYIAALALTDPAHAQENRWTVITTSQETLRVCFFGLVDGDRFGFTCTGATRTLSADSVARVLKTKESRFWSGVGYGALVGTIAGAGIGYASYEKPKGNGFNLDFGPGFNAAAGGFAGLILGSAVGGIAGAAAGADEVHDLAPETHAERVRILNELAAEHD